MAIKYRNTDTSKPNLTQTESSTAQDPKLNKAKQVRRDQDNVKNISVGIYDVDSAFKNFFEKGEIKNIFLEKFNLVFKISNVFQSSFAKVINNYSLVAGFNQAAAKMGANKTSAAGDNNFSHIFP